MTETRVVFHTEIPNSYRAARVASRLDLEKRRAITREIVFETPPDPTEGWRVGMIVGPSGSGKSTAAKALYGDSVLRRPTWDDASPVIDQFAPCDFAALESALAAVGFAAPTRQLAPYGALSAGERFRVELARTLLEAPAPVVVDEFTSALDRPIARAAAIATRKALERGVFDRTNRRASLVAVTCHDDVARWLEPDWLLDMRTGRVARGRLRRPSLEIAVRKCSRALWSDFEPFHYLSGTLNRAAQCYAALLNDEPCAFAAILQCEGRRGRRRVHRLVVRPEWQGLGLGGAFLDALGALERERGATLEIVTGAPFFARRLTRSPLWRLRNVYPHGRVQRHHGRRSQEGSHGRAVASFEYVGS